MLVGMAVRQRRSIVLDCDPGHDDAIAIVVAARHTNLLGITTVAGNAPLDLTTRNAIIMRDLLGDRRRRAHRRRASARRRAHSTPTTSTARAASTAPTCPSRRGPADEHRRGRLHHRDLPRQRGHVARADRAADEHRARAARRSRSRRSHRRHLADGRRHVRQPDRGGRVQHLGRPRGRRRRVRRTAAR